MTTHHNKRQSITTEHDNGNSVQQNNAMKLPWKPRKKTMRHREDETKKKTKKNDSQKTCKNKYFNGKKNLFNEIKKKENN